jgi:peptide/nickel transport system substrate-binding protein
VKFSFDRFATAGPSGEKAAYAADWAALERVEANGPLSGRLVLKHPAPALWTTALADISGAILSRKACAALGDRIRTRIVGSGPFAQAEWLPNQRLVLRANPGWRGPPPDFEEIVLRPVQDMRTAALALRAGEIDFSPVDLMSLGQVQRYPRTRLTRIDALDYVWIGLNVSKPPLDDRRVRQAVRAAIDVDAVLLAAYDGRVERARTLIPPRLLGHWQAAPLHPRDLAAARRLLAEAGWPDGFATRITVLNEARYVAAAEVVQANLAEAGIRCEVDARDGGSFWSAGKGRAGEELDLALQVFKGKADPSFYTQWFVGAQIGGWNWQRWSSPEFDRLHEVAAATLDETARAAAFIAMQQLMHESSAFIWLTHDVLAFAARDWLAPALLPNGSEWQLAAFRRA